MIYELEWMNDVYNTHLGQFISSFELITYQNEKSIYNKIKSKNKENNNYVKLEIINLKNVKRLLGWSEYKYIFIVLHRMNLRFTVSIPRLFSEHL